MENNIKRKIIEIIINGSSRYFNGFYDDGTIDSNYNIGNSMNLIELTDIEVDSIISTIVSKPRDGVTSVKVVEYEISYSTTEFINNDFKIKNAINKLTTEELELLGLEEMAFESILNGQYKEPDIHIEESDNCDSYCDDDIPSIEYGLSKEVDRIMKDMNSSDICILDPNQVKTKKMATYSDKKKKVGI